jgi:hypothetical protein
MYAKPNVKVIKTYNLLRFLIICTFIFIYLLVFLVSFNENIAHYSSPDAVLPSYNIKYGLKLDFYYAYFKPIRIACSANDCFPVMGQTKYLSELFVTFLSVDLIIMFLTAGFNTKQKRTKLICQLILVLLLIPFSYINPFLYILAFTLYFYFIDSKIIFKQLKSSNLNA